jgi:hypothetical protein
LKRTLASRREEPARATLDFGSFQKWLLEITRMRARDSEVGRVRTTVALASYSRRFIVAALVTTASAPARADEAPRRYFYRDLPYGSQSLDNPLYITINTAFDTLQVRADRTVSQVKLSDAQNVVENFASPLRPIRRDPPSGWKTFISQELLPLDWTQTGARWVPNYTLHLLGGGMSYANKREWFMAHEAPAELATVLSIALTSLSSLINESLENKGVRGDNTDCIADLWVFDPLAIILFSFEDVRRFFGETVRLLDWSLQPTLTAPRGELENVGAYFALKVPLPLQDRVRLLAYGGYQTLGGASVRIGHELSVSAAAGVRISTLENAGGAASVQDYVTLRPASALFLDRNDSLLVSLHVADVNDRTVLINVYPNAFFTTGSGMGGWMAMGMDGKWMGGISFAHGVGIGPGAKR